MHDLYFNSTLEGFVFVQDLFQSWCGFSTATSSTEGSILVTRSLSIMWRIFYSYIFFRMFYFGDKISLNHVADFLQLHLLQNVLFWWWDLSQSYGGFSTATSSSEGSILVTGSFSIIKGALKRVIIFIYCIMLSLIYCKGKVIL